MIDPVLLVLSRFRTGVVRVVHGQVLGLCGRQYGQNRHRDRLRRHGGPPAIAQEAQTDVSVRVHVLVDGQEFFQKVDRRGDRRVGARKFYPELEDFPLVDGVLGADYCHDPEPDVGADLDRQVFRWGFEEGLEFFLDSVIRIRRFDVGREVLLGRHRCRLLFCRFLGCFFVAVAVTVDFAALFL